jgi:hypothetical protein
VEAEEVLIYQWQGPKIVTPSAKEAISALDADRRAGSRSHRRRWPAGHHRRVLLAVTIIGIHLPGRISSSPASHFGRLARRSFRRMRLHFTTLGEVDPFNQKDAPAEASRPATSSGSRQLQGAA